VEIELNPHPETPKPQAALLPGKPQDQFNPYASPHSPLTQPLHFDDQIQSVAKAQRMLLLSVLASIVGNILMRSNTYVGLAMIPILLGIAAFSIWCVYRLCKALDKSPVLWIIAMFIPLVNLICLVALNSSATSFLKSHGLKVGLLGVKV